MKLKILLATTVVLMAGCNPSENAADPQSAANTASEAAAPAVTDADVAPAVTEQPATAHSAPVGTEQYPSVQRGSTLSAAGSSGDMAPLLISGWSGMESWGVWSDGSHARIGFKIDAPVATDVQLSLLLKAFLTATKPELVVVPSVNGRSLPPITLAGDQAEPSSHEISVPSQDVMQANGRIQIDFDIQDSRSPKEMGMSEDSRKLGLGLIEISVQ